MYALKRVCARMLFVAEILIFTYVYFFGAYGFGALLVVREECSGLAAQVQERTLLVKGIQDQIIAWNVHSYPKEKLAREQLQMARKDEVVYLLS